jgi:hypothetical protein
MDATHSERRLVAGSFVPSPDVCPRSRTGYAYALWLESEMGL